MKRCYCGSEATKTITTLYHFGAEVINVSHVCEDHVSFEKGEYARPQGLLSGICNLAQAQLEVHRQRIEDQLEDDMFEYGVTLDLQVVKLSITYGDVQAKLENLSLHRDAKYNCIITFDALEAAQAFIAERS